MPFLFHAAGISRSQGDHFKTEGHFKNSQREFISSRLCRLLIAALSYQRLPPRGSWILRSKRLKEIALVKTLHKFHLYALSLSHLRCQLPLGRSLKSAGASPRPTECTMLAFPSLLGKGDRLRWMRSYKARQQQPHPSATLPPSRCGSVTLGV